MPASNGCPSHAALTRTVVIVLVAMFHRVGMMQGMQNAVAGAANKGYVEQKYVNRV